MNIQIICLFIKKFHIYLILHSGEDFFGLVHRASYSRLARLTQVLRCLGTVKTETEKIYSPSLFLTFRLAMNAKLHQKIQ